MEGICIKLIYYSLSADEQSLLIISTIDYLHQPSKESSKMSMINAHDLEGKTVAFVNFATGTAIDLKDGAPLLTICFVPLT